MTTEQEMSDDRITECSCPTCQTACTRNPGWMTPDQADAALDQGFAASLMRDWLEPCSEVGNDERIYILAPASVGCEGSDAPEMDLGDIFSMLSGDWCKGCCTFFADGLCSIHESGFKPLQCAAGNPCDDTHSGIADNFEVARLWNTDQGRSVVARWTESVREHYPAESVCPSTGHAA